MQELEKLDENGSWNSKLGWKFFHEMVALGD